MRTLVGKDNDKYLRILEAVSIKLTKIKEKVFKNTLEEQENFSKPKSTVEMLSDQ